MCVCVCVCVRVRVCVCVYVCVFYVHVFRISSHQDSLRSLSLSLLYTHSYSGGREADDIIKFISEKAGENAGMLQCACVSQSCVKQCLFQFVFDL